jgi:hypothetical protein
MLAAYARLAFPCYISGMARRPDGLTARTESISARWRPETAALLDRLRGSVPRSRYLEHLVIEESKRTPRKKEIPHVPE